jgi:hypothetical protein
MSEFKSLLLTGAVLMIGVAVVSLSTPAQEPPDASCIRSCAKDHADRVRACKGDKDCIDASVAALRQCVNGCGVPSH